MEPGLCIFVTRLHALSPRNDIGLVTEVKVPQLVLEHLKAEKGLDAVSAVEAIGAVGPHSAVLLSVIRRVSYLYMSTCVHGYVFDVRVKDLHRHNSQV